MTENISVTDKMAETSWHTLSADDVIKRLETRNGLTHWPLLQSLSSMPLSDLSRNIGPKSPLQPCKKCPGGRGQPTPLQETGKSVLISVHFFSKGGAHALASKRIKGSC